MATRRCPRCGSTALEIVYGLPSFELFEAADRGEVVLGGCDPDGPKFRCAGVDCGLQFGGKWPVDNSNTSSNLW